MHLIARLSNLNLFLELKPHPNNIFEMADQQQLPNEGVNTENNPQPGDPLINRPRNTNTNNNNGNQQQPVRKFNYNNEMIT